MEEEIRKRGMLYQYQHRFGKKWRKVWCVLLADSMHSVARMELYEFRQASMNEGHSMKRSESKKIILLRDCIQIAQREGRECPKNCATFQIETVSKLFTFATNAVEVNSWVTELCRLAFPLNQAEGRLAGQVSVFHPPERDQSSVEMKENSLYETAASVRDFLVIVMGTEAAVRCNLYGEYILTPNDDCILLKDHKTKQVIFSWPYCFIRKFGQDRLCFSFEAGRRCQTGEGNFEFTTNQGERIFRIVSGAIQDLPQAEKPRCVEDVKQILENMEDSCAYSTVNHTVSDQDGTMSSDVKKHPIKKLTPTFRSLSLNAIEPQNKSQVRGVNSCPSATASELQEPLYASVSKPRGENEPRKDKKTHWQGIRDYVNQLSPLADPPESVVFSEEEVTRGTVKDEMLGLSADINSEDYAAEAIYSVPEDYEGHAPWVVTSDYHFPVDVLGSNEAEQSGEELEDLQEDGFSTYDNLSRAKRL